MGQAQQNVHRSILESEKAKMKDLKNLVQEVVDLTKLQISIFSRSAEQRKPYEQGLCVLEAHLMSKSISVEYIRGVVDFIDELTEYECDLEDVTFSEGLCLKEQIDDTLGIFQDGGKAELRLQRAKDALRNQGAQL